MNRAEQSIALPLLAMTGPAALAQWLVAGIDRKFAYDAEGHRQALEPGREEVLFFDIANPDAPRLAGRPAFENSIVGPPPNLATTPDQRAASSVVKVSGPPASLRVGSQ